MTVKLRALASPPTAPDISSDMPDWRQSAVCASTDPELFYPEKGSSTRAAKKICAGCPFTAQCLEWALSRNELYGIWGGLSERERRGLPGRVTRVHHAPCGSAGGYRAHYRRGEKPCEPCRDADKLRRAIGRGAA